MNLQLLPIGKLDGGLLRNLAGPLANTFGIPCEILSSGIDPQFAFHSERQQYHSSELLALLQKKHTQEAWRILGVTAVDLYIPILTFVFGEAQIGGPCAVVSLHRLTQEFYGLPGDKDLLHQRLLKEAVHELGHTVNLMHCDDYRCAMAPSHAVEWIDLKESTLCANCHGRIFETQISWGT